MKFKAGKPSDVIITDEPLDKWHARMTPDLDNHLEYYGGYVVCESVHPKAKPLLIAAPELLEALKEIDKIASEVPIAVTGINYLLEQLMHCREAARAAIAEVERDNS